MPQPEPAEPAIRIVSFVIPALNAAATLEACLTAIRSARRPGIDIEVFVIDNGSTDDTVEIARRHGVSVARGPGLTVAGLRNLGACRAQGAILAFVDADCVIAPDWIEKGLLNFREPHVAAAGSPTNVPPAATWVERAWELHRHRANRRKLVDWLPTVSLLVRRSAFRRVGGFNDALATCEDVDLGYRLAAHHRLVSDPDIKSIHLGEPRSLWRFFTKEIWRGKQNLTGLLSHGLRLSEVPSLALPLYHAACSAALLACVGHAMVSGWWGPTLAVASLLLLPPIGLALGTSVRTRRITLIPSLTLLYFTYATARAIALAAGALPCRPPARRAPRSSAFRA